MIRHEAEMTIPHKGETSRRFRLALVGMHRTRRSSSDARAPARPVERPGEELAARQGDRRQVEPVSRNSHNLNWTFQLPAAGEGAAGLEDYVVEDRAGHRV